MTQKDKEDLDKEIAAFLEGLVKGCAYFLGKNATFGFKSKFELEGRKYIISLGEQTTQFEYLKDN